VEGSTEGVKCKGELEKSSIVNFSMTVCGRICKDRLTYRKMKKEGRVKEEGPEARVRRPGKLVHTPP